MRIVLSSFNKNKFLEINATSKAYGLDLCRPVDIEVELGLQQFEETDEVGTTYAENALLKAKDCSSWCKLPSLGDDSGLEVDALGGAPGLYSKRYANTDAERIGKLVRELQGKKGKERSCRFRCVLAYHDPKSDLILYSEGILEGEVLGEPRGDRGFGYDPIVFVYELGATLAEIDEKTLFEKGFRAKAARGLFEMDVFRGA